jgi:hypothetical protein
MPKGKEKNNETILVVAIIVILLAAAFVGTRQVPKSIGVYSDSACTQPLTSINWGTILPGGSVTRTIYIKNMNTTQITLSMTKTDWNPARANGPITLTWDKEGTTLTANQIATATLTLNVSPSINSITTFRFNIVITGTNVPSEGE